MDRNLYIEIVTNLIMRQPNKTLDVTGRLSVKEYEMCCGKKYEYDVPISEITISCSNSTKVWENAQFEVNLWGKQPNGCDRVFTLDQLSIETLRDIIRIVHNNKLKDGE